MSTSTASRPDQRQGAAPVGAPLMNTPKHAFTLWNVYQIAPRFEVGGGSRFVSSQYTQNVPPIKTVPEFWTFDAMAKYAFTPNIAAQLNVNNLTNRYYYDQLHFFHVVPGPGRTALLGLTGTLLIHDIDHSRAAQRRANRRFPAGARRCGVGVTAKPPPDIYRAVPRTTSRCPRSIR